MRVLDITIDYQNHLNVLGHVGDLVLYYLSLIIYIASYTALLVSWCHVVKNGLASPFFAKLVL